MIDGNLVAEFGEPILLPTGSAVQRAMACPSSCALPQVREETSPEAHRGTTVHEFLRAVIGDGVDTEEALSRLPERDPGRRACEELDLSAIPRGGLHEVALAWDPFRDEARVLGYDIKRAYAEHGADLSREFVLSVDLCGDLRDSRVFVLDFKTGYPQWSARESWQLRIGAVAWAACRKADEALVGHLVITGSGVRPDLHEIDSLALGDYRAQLRDLARRLKRMRRGPDLGGMDVAEGPHCRYCPAFSRCPAKVGLVRDFARTATHRGGLMAEGAVVTRSAAAEVWKTIEAWDAVKERLQAQIEKLAEQEPLDLGDGRELRIAEGKEQERVDQEIVFGVLAEERIAVNAFIEWRVSKKALDALLRAEGERRNDPTLRSRVMGRIRMKGGIKLRAGEERVRVVDRERRGR